MWDTLAWFALAELVFSLSPGPAVFLVISQAIWRGLPASLASIAGILVVNVLYFMLSAFGIGAVLAASPEVFHWLKVAGAIYLIWTAGEIIYGLINATDNDGIYDSSTGRAFLKGIALQSSNAKNLIIFISILPQFVNPTEHVGYQLFALGAVSVLVELPVLLLYALLAIKLGKITKSLGYARVLDTISAIILLLIAASLVWI